LFDQSKLGEPEDKTMALDGINYLVAITQIKASNANDNALGNQPKPTNQKTTSFDTYSKAVSETLTTTLATADSLLTRGSTGETETARKQRESLITSVLTNIANMKHESLKGIANNLRG
jgi:hypothetical protein